MAHEDSDALAELLRRCHPLALRFARRAVRRESGLDLDELVSLALTKLWRALPSFDADQPFLPWASVVMSRAVRTGAAAQRTNGRRFNWNALLRPLASEDPHSSPLDRVVERSSGPDGNLLRSVDEEILREYLSSLLSATEARVLRLRLGGWTYAEIATRLGVKEKAIDNAVRRALTKLREDLGDPAGLRDVLEATSAPS